MNLRKSKFLYPLKWIYHLSLEKLLYLKTKKVILKRRKKAKRIYYFGIPVHNNLGDLAQGVCIREWIQKHYPDYECIEIETNAIVNTRFSVLKQLKKVVKESDFFIFQSGYTTTDLGGYADEMHKIIMQSFPKQPMLMMPQTVFFKNKEREKETSFVYNSCARLLFLARDRISFEKAEKMFPDTKVLLFPDIVTTRIGKRDFNSQRKGVVFCLRNDSEKYYSDTDINKIIISASDKFRCFKTDTTKEFSKGLINNPEQYINEEIELFSKFRVVVTDRYHGTIFALAARTPVIVLKTTDHKVTTGLEWFKKLYDDYIYYCDSLDNLENVIEHVLSKKRSNYMQDFFEKQYYDNLPNEFSRFLKD